MGIGDLPKRYLFTRIQQAKEELLAHDPTAKLISLGIGDTTQPLPPTIATALAEYAQKLGTSDGYGGYGPAEGWPALRAALADNIYGGRISPDEVFVSDGAKCDIGRLAFLLGRDCRAAVQDPSYPVYLDLSHILGHPVTPLPCTPDNHFFPDALPAADLLYLCSPNNPTGAVMTGTQMHMAVSWAREHNALILFDAAYAPYISDPALPRSIYEIPGADEVAIELGSFSKLAGFTGVRLGWTVVPRKHSMHRHWPRLVNTLFNGPSNIAQAGGIAALAPEGWHAIQTQLQTYKANAAALRKTLKSCNIAVYGGEHAPYLWVHLPGINSWDAFGALLHEVHLVTVPGSGFGPCGEEFLRLSAFAAPAQIQEACQLLGNALPDVCKRLRPVA